MNKWKKWVQQENSAYILYKKKHALINSNNNMRKLSKLSSLSKIKNDYCLYLIETPSPSLDSYVESFSISEDEEILLSIIKFNNKVSNRLDYNKKDHLYYSYKKIINYKNLKIIPEIKKNTIDFKNDLSNIADRITDNYSTTFIINEDGVLDDSLINLDYCEDH